MFRHSARFLAAGLLAVALAAVFLVVRRGRSPFAWHTAPNVIIIQLDTIRADHVGCYGYPRPTTPNVDRFARSGLQFRNAYSVTSWTLPAVTSLLTGLRPSRHGVRAIGDLLPDNVPTLAHALKDSGYNTAAISANFAFVHPTNSYPKPPLHLGQGFNSFEMLWQRANPDDGEAEPFRGQLIRTVRADTVTAKMDAFIRTTKEPFFLYAVYIDPHYGYEPPGDYAKMFEPAPIESALTGFMKDVSQLKGPLSPSDIAHLTNLYDGEIRFADEQVGAFLRALDDTGLANRTVVVILSDHGESFMEHGKMLHGQTLYNEEIHIPLLMRGPDVPAGVVDQLVSITDVMPTVLELAGVPGPQGLDGRSLVSTWRRAASGAGGASADGALQFELDNESDLLNGPRLHSRGVRDGEWKLIGSLDGRLELYDIATDPDEHHDVAQANPAIRNRLAADLDHHPAATAPPAARPTLSEAEKERLRALGYGTGPN